MSTVPQNTESTEKPLRVRRGKVSSVDLYEVKEDELLILENGDSNNIIFNIAVALISLSCSTVLALCTASFVKPIFQTLFLFLTVIGFIVGAVLLIIWYQFRRPIKELVKIIRRRIPPDIPSDVEAAPKLPE